MVAGMPRQVPGDRISQQNRVRSDEGTCVMAGISMSDDPSAAFRLTLREALIALEAASVAVEVLGRSAPLKHGDDTCVAGFINAALEAVRRLDTLSWAKPKIIFPNAGTAQTWCDNHRLSDGLCYQIHRDGAGRCAVSINAPLEFL
jgi:hypothetical protein